MVPKLPSLILTVTRRNLQLRHLYCTERPIFSKKSQGDFNYRFAKKLNAPKPAVTCKFKLCYQALPRFYALQQHTNTQPEIPIKTANVDLDDNINEVDELNLKDNLRSCHHFLDDTDFEKTRDKVFNYAVESLNETIVNKKLDNFFNNIKCAAEMNLAFRFNFENI